MIVIFIGTNLISRSLHKVQTFRFNGVLLKCEGIIPCLCVGKQGLVKLGILSGEDLSISSWWINLAEKLSVYGIMDLLSEMATDTKR